MFTHDVVAEGLYHDVLLGQEDAVRRLTGLTLYCVRGSNGHRRTPPAYCIKTLTYVSTSQKVDNSRSPHLESDGLNGEKVYSATTGTKLSTEP